MLLLVLISLPKSNPNIYVARQNEIQVKMILT